MPGSDVRGDRRLLLITASSPEMRSIRRARVIHFQQCTMPYLAALTPHAYALADFFRDRGTPVVLGGPHVTLVPDEAGKHADAVFTGEVEETWPRFLREFDEGRHATRYACGTPPSLVDELIDGFTWINERFYSVRSIARRLSRSPTNLWWTLPLNLKHLYAWRRHGRSLYRKV